MEYSLVACGGTFDKLHAGHKAFLRFAFSAGEKVVIGLTTSRYISKFKKNQKIAPYAIRKKNLEVFLEKESFLQRAKIVPLNDTFGPSIDRDFFIDALIVTQDSIQGANAINTKRKEKGLSFLPIVIAPLIAIHSVPIASSLVRTGFMNKDGKFIIDSSWLTKTHALPMSLRENLHKPFGKLYVNGIEEIKKLDADKIITVGDITTVRFLENNIFPKLCVFDLVVKRKKTFQTFKELGFSGKEKLFFAKNPPGTLTPQLWLVLEKIIREFTQQERYILQIFGEEDLVVIPLILLFPIGYSIFYGQPDSGLVQVVITKSTRKRAINLLERF